MSRLPEGVERGERAPQAVANERSQAPAPAATDCCGWAHRARFALVSMEDNIAAGEKAAEAMPQNEFLEELVAHGPPTLLEEGEEKTAREAALISAVNTAGQTGMPSAQVGRLRELVLGERSAAFRRALVGEAAVHVEPLRVKLKPQGPLQHVKAKPRDIPRQN